MLVRMITRVISWLAVCMLAVGLVPAHGSDPWKPAIGSMDDPFVTVPETLDALYVYEWAWVKFTEVFAQPGGAAESILYFQDSRNYPFHYPFAVAHLEAFRGMDQASFDHVTLYELDRSALLGAVIWIRTSGKATPAAVGIQFASQDELPREEVARAFHRVAGALGDIHGVPLYYLPTYEQAARARTDEAWLAAEGVTVGAIDQWASPESTYAPGWAVGRLVEIAPDDIAQAYVEGRLRPDDILLTERVPAEIPLVAGVVTRRPATPNSHVAILATSWRIPFVHVDAGARALEAMAGQRVTLSAPPYFWGTIGLRPLDPAVPDAILESLRALKAPPPLDLPAMEESGGIWMDVEGAGPADIGLIGGKAAHFGLLREAIPDNSPRAIALTFDLWNAFLDQPLPARGRSLREEIRHRLAPFQSYPPNFGALSVQLAEIQRIIRNETVFTQEQRDTLQSVLTIHFDADRRIRFRSSTNMEDSDHFTGAGLYDSYSGCLLDDLYPHAPGPSHCDPERNEKRGVFRAIRRVYASFYNENAFLERLRHEVEDGTVGMAVLVHHSFPDEIELANGVAIFTPDERTPLTGSARLKVVTQKGAVSVTNPTGDSVPEVVTATLWSNFPSHYSVDQASNLLLLGEPAVMDLPADYDMLADHLVRTHAAFAAARPELATRPLEFEFKKTAPDGSVVVKQIRPLALDPEVESIRFLLAGEVDLEVYQGEQSDALALHRAKSQWRVTAPSQELDLAGGQAPFWSGIRYERAEAGERLLWEGDPRDWPGYRARVQADTSSPGHVALHSWNETVAGLPSLRSLRVEVPLHGVAPWVHPDDLSFAVVTDYPRQPAPWDTWPIGWPEPEPNDPVSEHVRLIDTELIADLRPGGLPQHRVVNWGGISVRTSFFWPPEPTGLTAGYTAPLVEWMQTRVTGLTAEPITLREPFAQTYRPDHHNFGERFVFEPRLDPAVPEHLRAELEARGIEGILVSYNSSFSAIRLMHSSGELSDPMAPWLGEPEYLSAGQARSPWFGVFDATRFPYVVHAGLGSVHVTGAGAHDLWLWNFDGESGWLWTREGVFPYAFHLASGRWIYHVSDVPEPEWWYDVEAQDWFHRGAEIMP
jgi:hypothetical protein